MIIRENKNLKMGTLEDGDDVHKVLEIDGYKRIINDDIFGLDNWSSNDVVNYLCGLLESSFSEDGTKLDFMLTLDGISFVRDWHNEPLFKEAQKRLGRVRKLWLSGNQKEFNSKKYCVEWASKKNLNISWLNYALDKGYLEIEQENKLSEKERNNLYTLIGTLHDLLTNIPIGSLPNYAFKNEDEYIFKNQEQLIRFIQERYSHDYQGLSKSQLEKVFPKAKAFLK